MNTKEKRKKKKKKKEKGMNTEKTRLQKVTSKSLNFYSIMIFSFSNEYIYRQKIIISL